MQILKNQCIYIWGAGVAGQLFYERIKNEDIQILGFIDSIKKGTKYLDIPIYAPEEVTKTSSVMIVIATLDFVSDIEKWLLERGYILDEDFCYCHIFLQYIMWRWHGKVYSHHLNVHITDWCSYRCKKCSVYIPYIKAPKHMDYVKMKKGLDSYFTLVDYVSELHLLGGEPLLYPQLVEILKYICENYRKCIGELAIATNGSVMPMAKLLDLCRKYDVFFTISDYSKSPAFDRVSNIDELVRLLEDEGVKYRLGDKSEWFDFECVSAEKEDVADTKNKYNSCFFRNRVLKETKIYYCHHEAGAVWSGKYEGDAEGVLNLELEDKREKFLDFDRGINSKGYLSYCERCNGYERINHNYICAAEQIK